MPSGEGKPPTVYGIALLEIIIAYRTNVCNNEFGYFRK